MKNKICLKKNLSKKSNKAYTAITIVTPYKEIAVTFKIDEICMITGMSIEDVYNLPLGTDMLISEMEIAK